MLDLISHTLYCENEKSLMVHEYGFQTFEKRQTFLPPRFTSVYMLHFVTKGEGLLTLDTETYPLKKGDLFLCPIGVKLTYHSSTHNPYAYFWINFNGAEAEKILSQLQLSRKHPIQRPERFDDLENAFRELVMEQGGPSENLAYSTLYRIVHLVSQKHQPRALAKKSYCERIEEYIHANYADANLRVAHIAETLHISPHYMSRLFTAYRNESIIAYLVSYRMQKAKELLEQGFSVSEACERVGYDDLCTFSKTYKRTFGYSPKHTAVK